jgi:hydroxypyruvate reductase
LAAGELRGILLECFEAALAAVDARRCVRTSLEMHTPPGEFHVVAIGKAAGAMTSGAADALGHRMLGALVVTSPGHGPKELAAMPNVRVVESAHPEPDERSLVAGEEVSRFVSGLPRDAAVLFLVSGGASSLVERLAAGVSLGDLAALNAWALRSGRAIDEVNALRRAISTLKGGGLAALVGSRSCLALMISDVPRDDPAVIGSGLLHVTRAAHGLPSDLPDGLRRVIGRARSRRTARSVPKVPYRIVASGRDACRAAASHGRALGLEVHVSRGRFSGDAARLGHRFARAVLAGRPRILHVWGGESTMTLPDPPGYGGRNQHLALAAALELAGHRGAVLLAAGTDGIDGATTDAGAVVDGGTRDRGLDAGFDASRSLAAADSGRFLEASGDLLHTGPTLTNVGDVVLGLRGRNRIA